MKIVHLFGKVKMCLLLEECMEWKTSKLRSTFRHKSELATGSEVQKRELHLYCSTYHLLYLLRSSLL